MAPWQTRKDGRRGRAKCLRRRGSCARRACELPLVGPPDHVHLRPVAPPRDVPDVRDLVPAGCRGRVGPPRALTLDSPLSPPRRGLLSLPIRPAPARAPHVAVARRLDRVRAEGLVEVAHAEPRLDVAPAEARVRLRRTDGGRTKPPRWVREPSDVGGISMRRSPPLDRQTCGRPLRPRRKAGRAPRTAALRSCGGASRTTQGSCPGGPASAGSRGGCSRPAPGVRAWEMMGASPRALLRSEGTVSGGSSDSVCGDMSC